MRTDGTAEVQHYVPQLLLRLHAREHSKRGSEQVWCFDKKTDKVFSPNIKGILAESRFNEIEINDQVVSLEPALTRIESAAAPLIEKILETGSTVWLNQTPRQILASFLAVQFARTAAFRQDLRAVSRGLEATLRSRGFDPARVQGFRVVTDQKERLLALDFIRRAPEKFGPHFLARRWCLLSSTPDDPFHLGDHPVVRENELGQSFGLGLACRGLSIYMPLSPTICLCLLDPLVVQEIRNGLREARRFANAMRKELPNIRSGMRARAALELERLEEMQATIETKVRPMLRGHMPMRHDNQVVMRVNSLQMRWAARWVVSSKDDFSLPKRMIADDEAFRSAPGIRID